MSSKTKSHPSTARVIGKHADCGGEVVYVVNGSVGIRSCKTCGAHTFRADPVLLETEVIPPVEKRCGLCRDLPSQCPDCLCGPYRSWRE